MATDRQDAPSENNSITLEALLRDLFPSYKAFHRFVRELADGDGLVHELPNPESSESLAQLTFTAVRVLRSAGFIDTSFFLQLTRRFPRRRRDIRAEAARWAADASLLSSVPLVHRKRGAPRRVWISIAVALLLIASIIVLSAKYGSKVDDADAPVVFEPVAPDIPAPVTVPNPSFGSGASESDSPEPDSPEPAATAPLEPTNPNNTTLDTENGGNDKPYDAGSPGPPPPKPKQPPEVKQRAFADAITSIDLQACAKHLLQGSPSKKETTLSIEASFFPNREPVVIVHGSPRPELLECVKILVFRGVRTKFQGARSAKPVTADVRLKPN